MTCPLYRDPPLRHPLEGRTVERGFLKTMELHTPKKT